MAVAVKAVVVVAVPLYRGRLQTTSQECRSHGNDAGAKLIGRAIQASVGSVRSLRAAVWLKKTKKTLRVSALDRIVSAEVQ